MVLIRLMQLFGAVSLLFCVISMVSVIIGFQKVAVVSFAGALILMAMSLTCLVWEVYISGGALSILLRAMEKSAESKR